MRFKNRFLCSFPMKKIRVLIKHLWVSDLNKNYFNIVSVSNFKEHWSYFLGFLG